jgi:Hsp70 protein
VAAGLVGTENSADGASVIARVCIFFCSALYFHTFKVLLAPKNNTTYKAEDVFNVMATATAMTGNAPPASTSTALVLHSSAGGGAGSTAEAPKSTLPQVPAFLLVQRTLEFVKQDCFRFLETRMRTTDVGGLRIKWVVTVPAIWPDESKIFMRKAAAAAGLIASENADNLMLALEPEAAILASIADCAPSERARFTKGTKIMVVDCGGGTVDITVDEVVEPAIPGPLELKEISGASGGMWGATMVDKEFGKFLRELLGPEYYRQLDNRTVLECMISWESEKNTVSGENDEDDTVQVRCHELLDDLADKTDDEFTRETMQELVEQYNEKKGLTEESGGVVSFSKTKRLKIPPCITRSFYTTVIDQIVTHLQGKLAETGPVDAMMIAGGFAESRILQKILKEKFETSKTAVILPRRPGKVVVMGAALFALQPKVIRERVMRHSYGYLGAEPFNPAIHDESHVFVTAEGRRLVHILYPLVQKGDKVNVGDKISRSGLIPVRNDQQVIDFELFRTDQKVRYHSGGQLFLLGLFFLPSLLFLLFLPLQINDPRHVRHRTIVVDSLSHSGTHSEVLRIDKVGTLSITIGATDKPREQRGVNFEIRFGSTEIVAQAHSTVSKETREVKLRYGE